MRRRRLILLAIVAVLMFGSLGVVGGYAWYLRGDGYRERCAAALTESLHLPSEIGSVVPRGRSRREFRDVVVWLPERRGRALSCERALVVRTPSDDDPNAYEIELSGGSCEISTRSWLRQDYRGVVESGLRPGFAPDGPERVTFEDMNVSFERERFRVELQRAAGLVAFESPRSGRASITCRELNGYQCAEPVQVDVRFSPHNSGIRIDLLELITPELPLSVTRLRELTGVELTSGRFQGRVVYQEHDHGRRLVVGGKCLDLELTECTAGLTPVPWRGRCPEIELQELRVENGSPVRLRFRGVLTEVSLGDILATWGLTGIRGTLALDVGAAELSPRGIEFFVASGHGVDVSLESLSEALGWGRMTGVLDLTISDLTIENNHLKSLDASLVVADPAEQTNWVEVRLLRELVSRALHVELPRWLPERIEYTRLGVRLEVRDELLYIFGTHGPRETAILSVRLLEQELPLLFEPRRHFDLRPWLDQVRARATAHLEQTLPAPAEYEQP